MEKRMKSHPGKSRTLGLLSVSVLVVFLAACAHPRPAAAEGAAKPPTGVVTLKVPEVVS